MDRFIKDCKAIVTEVIATSLHQEGGFGVFQPTMLGNRFIRMNQQASSGDALWDWLSGAHQGAMLIPMTVDRRPALMLIVVDRDDPLSRIMVRHPTGDWEDIVLYEAPWLALSTAGALRAFFKTGTRAPIREASDKRLFGTINEPAPPTDREGRI